MNFFTEMLKTPDSSTQEYRNARDAHEKALIESDASNAKAVASKSAEDIRAAQECFERLSHARINLDLLGE